MDDALRREKDSLDLFVAHRPRLVEYATNVLGNAAHSEDVVQEAWVRFSAVPGARLLDDPLSYLFRIVRNIALDGRRRQVSQGRYLVAAAETDAALSAADDRPSPEAQALHRQQLATVRAALADLPERTRLAVEWHRLEGLKTREVAERLGISTTLAHNLIAEGVAHCRRRLARPG